MLDSATEDQTSLERGSKPPGAETQKSPEKFVPPADTPPEGNALARLAHKPLVIGLVLAALAAGLYFGISYWTVGRFMVTTDDAYVGVRAATLAPKVGGYVTEIAIGDNELVKTGDVIVRIDAGDYDLAVRAARDQSETQRSTVARIGKQIGGQQAVVDQMRAQAASARSAALKSDLDFKRQSELAARQINTAVALEQAQAARDQAASAVKAADAGTAAAVANVAVYEAQRVEAENVLKQNETALAKTERDRSFAEVRAPFDGVLGNRAIQVGDYVQPAQRIASLVPLQSVYIEANFKETQLARLVPGQPVQVKVDADGGKEFEAHVVSVAPASGSVFSLLPPDNATGNFTKIVQRIAVRIAVPEPIAAKSILRPGMSVVVRVNTKDRKSVV